MAAYDIGPFTLERPIVEPCCGHGAAIPTPEQIRYAEALRLQLREACLRRPASPPPAMWWCIGAD